MAKRVVSDIFMGSDMCPILHGFTVETSALHRLELLLMFSLFFPLNSMSLLVPLDFLALSIIHGYNYIWVVTFNINNVAVIVIFAKLPLT